jgi:hypothetical protein
LAKPLDLVRLVQIVEGYSVMPAMKHR